MKRLSIPLAALASLAIAGTALAAAPFQTFGTGDVSVSGDSVSIENDAGEYGGVHTKARSLANKTIEKVEVSFLSTGDVAGGAPRVNIPIDTDGDHAFDMYAVLDAANCGGTSGEETWVSTENPDCQVFFLGSGDWYPNWDAYVAAHPDHRVASKGEGSTPFIIADIEGSYELEGVDLQ